MKVIHGISHVEQRFRRPVLAIGVFDGVHRGHRQLIKRAIRRARSLKGVAVVMTFSPHPVHVLRPDVSLPLLTSLKHRLRLIEDLGADVCLVVRFTRRFARLSPEQFVGRYLRRKIGPEEIFVGDDFRFGHDRAGGLKELREAGRRYGFKVNIVKSVLRQGRNISSTLIRRYIQKGELRKAAGFLGHPVSVSGRVIRGASRGKKLGYPTANIKPISEIIPPPGVYLVRVLLDKKTYPGMANIGYQPSFRKKDSRQEKHLHVEVHILDFRGEIYKKEVTLEILKKIRDEKKFPSSEQLAAQLRRDERRARRFFTSSSR